MAQNPSQSEVQNQDCVCGRVQTEPTSRDGLDQNMTEPEPESGLKNWGVLDQSELY